MDDLVDSADIVMNLRLIVQKLDTTGDLKDMGDQFRKTLKVGGVALIGTIQNNKPMVMCAVTDDLTDKIQAGNIVNEVGILMGGGGGGKIIAEGTPEQVAKIKTSHTGRYIKRVLRHL